MRSSLNILSFLATGWLLVSLQSGHAADTSGNVAPQDGQHDFDFNIGTWNSHVTRTLDPLLGSAKKMTMEGTVTVRAVWGGRAQLEEIEADGPAGHWEGMTLFLYNPTSGQWTQSYAESDDGRFQADPQVGSRVGDNIVLFTREIRDGRSILAKGVWSHIRPDSHRYEIFYSADGGASWHSAFIAELTRKES